MKKKTITLEEYEAEVRAHDPPPDEDTLQNSLKCLGKAINKAALEDEEQEFIDCATGKPAIKIYPDGGIHFIRSLKVWRTGNRPFGNPSK